MSRVGGVQGLILRGGGGEAIILATAVMMRLRVKSMGCRLKAHGSCGPFDFR